MKVIAPANGTVTDLAAVADPVFAAGLVGPGVAIEPPDGVVDVVAPVGGRLVRCFPHAFVITGRSASVLVHVGINTAHVGAETFLMMRSQDDEVARGDQIVQFNTADVERAGAYATVLVVALDEGPDSLFGMIQAGTRVERGVTLFRIAQFT